MISKLNSILAGAFGKSVSWLYAPISWFVVYAFTNSFHLLYAFWTTVAAFMNRNEHSPALHGVDEAVHCQVATKSTFVLKTHKVIC